MKKFLLIIILFIFLVIIALFFILTPKQTNLDVELSTKYDILFTKNLGSELVLYGLVEKKKMKDEPYSLIAVYNEKKAVYQFLPVVPDSVNYPRPLDLENVEIVELGDELSIVTSWGETGANYFGTHPIVIYFADGKFRAFSFYTGNISDDPRIKDISWTRKDFYIKNYFDDSEEVKTILTQGVSVTKDKKIELSFYGDELPHAAEHKIIKIAFPLAIKSYPIEAFVIEAIVGEKIVLTLDSNPTTGYSWELAGPIDDKFIEFLNSEYMAPETKLVGAGGHEMWTFKALKKGKTTIVMKYVRPWEKDKPPAEIKKFEVNISEAKY